MNESEFFLQDFFKKKSLKNKSIDTLWNNFEKEGKKHELQINKNIQKIGEVENWNNESQNLKDIYNNYQDYFKRHRTVKNKTNKELRDLFLILFSNPNEGVIRGLYKNKEQFDDFLNILIHKNNQRNLRNLISELLYYYPEKDEILFDRLNKIYSKLDSKRNSNKLLFEANKKFHLLKKSGPDKIAQNILDISIDLNTLLTQLWIRDGHLQNGIGNKIVENLCQKIQQVLERLTMRTSQSKDKQILKRFLKYLSIESNNKASIDQNKALRGEGKRDLIVKTILNPFKNIMPEKMIKTTITRFLDQHIGDPRFSPENWIAIKAQKAIFLKWKIGETIEDFLELLSYTAKQDPNSDRMWPYRKEFIKTYWDAGYIKDAWIVLGKKAYKNRSKFLKEDLTNYGSLEIGVNPIHSALLFKIGDLTISEWNYNGTVRIWRQGNKFSPDFYKEEYSRMDLIKKANKEIGHFYAERYSWQKRLSDYIEKYTGIYCPKILQEKIDKNY